MKTHRLAALALLVALAACAGTPGPGDPGYLFNVAGDYSGQFAVGGQALPANMVLDTAPGGVVTGAFGVPMMGIEGEIEGEIVGDQITFVAGYHNPETGCDGVASAAGTVTENGASLEGQIEVTECGEYMAGSFRFSR